MAGKDEKKKGSILRDTIFRGDPDELRLQPNETVTVVPLHGVEEGVESYVHAVSYQFRGRWDRATCALESAGECPFCEHPNQEVSRTVPRSFMLLYLPKSEEIKYMALPISVIRALLKWEDGANEEALEDKKVTVRGRRVVLSRTGSGMKTKYDAAVYGDVSAKIDLSKQQANIDRIGNKMQDKSKPLSVPELRDIVANAFLQIRDREPTAENGEPEIPAGAVSVEEEEW